jgi:hypothetical protein
VIAVFFDSTGAGHAGGVITNDTLSVSPNTASGTTNLVSLGATCGAPSASLLNPDFDTAFFSSCTLATFQTALTMTFPSPTGVDPALASLSFPATTINGMRIVDPVNNNRRIQSMLHALHSQLKPL